MDALKKIRLLIYTRGRSAGIFGLHIYYFKTFDTYLVFLQLHLWLHDFQHITSKPQNLFFHFSWDFEFSFCRNWGAALQSCESAEIASVTVLEGKRAEDGVNSHPALKSRDSTSWLPGERELISCPCLPLVFFFTPPYRDEYRRHSATFGINTGKNTFKLKPRTSQKQYRVALTHVTAVWFHFSHLKR